MNRLDWFVAVTPFVVLAMFAAWKLRHSQLMFTTNGLGAAGRFAVGELVRRNGRVWRVTKHRNAHDGWGGVNVYGRPRRGSAT